MYRATTNTTVVVCVQQLYARLRIVYIIHTFTTSYTYTNVRLNFSSRLLLLMTENQREQRQRQFYVKIQNRQWKRHKKETTKEGRVEKYICILLLIAPSSSDYNK
jgi:hypothetical protein